MSEFSVSVSELNEYVRGRLQMDPMLKMVSVKGEISDYKLQLGSGHAYFTLKDEKATISCTMWRSNVSLLKFVPKPGKKVTVKGQVTLYVPGGKYQLIADFMSEDGTGDLFARFEELKNRLAMEGLFDTAIKKPLPLKVKTIGVATSLSGAAIRDIIKVARARNPKVDIIIAPCSVQGKGSEFEIAASIDMLDRDGRSDVILVGRGGGSMEDLWAFNEEAVVRAIYRCKTPVISCVGHETDFSIADFAADVRASTPSNAAELAVADIKELDKQLNRLMLSLNSSMLNAQKQRRQRIEAAFNRPVFKSPHSVFIDDRSMDCEVLYKKAASAFVSGFEKRKTQLESLNRLLGTLNPNNVKSRGYAVVKRSGSVITGIEKIRIDDLVTVEVSDGEFDAKISDLRRYANEK
ncbi:MAG: exodeoxyribonuclease VII large subunit [Clostridia bacterium]|nr:exodeoxyribonuclease VII large subunit [Clostridia bacterium]